MHFYGSKAQPKRVFGEDTPELDAFYDAQFSVAPGACTVMQEFLQSWQPNALEHSHTLPDNFHAIVPVLQKFKSKIEIDELDHATLTYIYEDNVGTEEGLAVAANMTHAVDGFIVRELVRRCNYDEGILRHAKAILEANRQESPIIDQYHYMENAAINHGFISLRGADYISNETVLVFSRGYREELLGLINEVLEYDKSFPVLTIHDEFKCHPNHVNRMREVYQQILAELADSRVGEQIIQEVRNDSSYSLQKLSTDLGDAIMKSEYFLS